MNKAKIKKVFKIIGIIYLIIISLFAFSGLTLFVRSNLISLDFVQENESEREKLMIKLDKEYCLLDNSLKSLDDIDCLDSEVRNITNAKLVIRNTDTLNSSGILGKAFPVVDTIYINKTLYKNRNNNSYFNDSYLHTLAHEYIHVSNFTINERYTEFTSFKVLYESDNPYLKRAGIYIALISLQAEEDYKEYNCSSYIINYFKTVN